MVVIMGAAGAGAVAWRGEPDATAGPSAGEAKPAQDPDPPWRPSEDEVEQARAMAAGLNLSDLAGQLIVARHFGNEASLELVRDKHFAGVLVTSPQILDVATSDPLEQVKAFNTELNEAGDKRGVPVLVPIDQEGGLVARLGEPLTPFPSFMTSGAAFAGDPTGAAEVVRAAARASGAELRAVGYNAAFAPIGDLTVGADDPIIGSRSAGSDAEAAAAAVAAAVRGYGDAGLLSSVKHFPGHNVTEDSHRKLPRLDRSRSELAARDLKPFAAAMDVDAPSIMTGHLNVPALDDGVPASMSRAVVTDWLRKGLGYDGVIISDSLGMGPIMKRYPGGKAAVAALKAGSDLALMPAKNDAAHTAVLAALESGELPEKQARASAARTIAWLLHQKQSDPLPGEPGSGSEESEAVSAAGVTVVSRPCGEELDVETATPVGDPVAVTAFREAAADAGLTIGSGTTISFIGTGGTVTPGDIAVTTDAPYALARSAASHRIALYGTGQPAMRALIEVLTGRADAPGELPVEIPGLEPTRC